MTRTSKLPSGGGRYTTDKSGALKQTEQPTAPAQKTPQPERTKTPQEDS